MNNNMMELNLDEMEMIAAGDKTTDNMLSKGGKCAAAGAAIGAAAGTVFPVVGTTVGFICGAVAGFIEG